MCRHSWIGGEYHLFIDEVPQTLVSSCKQLLPISLELVLFSRHCRWICENTHMHHSDLALEGGVSDDFYDLYLRSSVSLMYLSLKIWRKWYIRAVSPITGCSHYRFVLVCISIKLLIHERWRAYASLRILLWEILNRFFQSCCSLALHLWHRASFIFHETFLRSTLWRAGWWKQDPLKKQFSIPLRCSSLFSPKNATVIQLIVEIKKQKQRDRVNNDPTGYKY